MKMLKLLIFLIPSLALAGTYVRPYGPSDYAGGAKAVGSKVNSEFADIASFLNGKNIASSNITSLGVTTDNLAAGSVTTVKLSPNYGVTAGSGLMTILGSTTLRQITNLSTTFTSYGKPVHLQLVPDAGGGTCGSTLSYISFTYAAGSSLQAGLYMISDSSTTFKYNYVNGITSASTVTEYYPCSMISHWAVPDPGSYTYSVKYSAVAGGAFDGVSFCNCKLVVQEF